jgi:hypothetical protein
LSLDGLNRDSLGPEPCLPNPNGDPTRPWKSRIANAISSWIPCPVASPSCRKPGEAWKFSSHRVIQSPTWLLGGHFTLLHHPYFRGLLCINLNFEDGWWSFMVLSWCVYIKFMWASIWGWLIYARFSGKTTGFPILSFEWFNGTGMVRRINLYWKLNGDSNHHYMGTYRTMNSVGAPNNNPIYFSWDGSLCYQNMIFGYIGDGLLLGLPSGPLWR